MSKQSAFVKKQKASERQKKELRRPVVALGYQVPCPVDGCGHLFTVVKGDETPMCDDCKNLLRRVTWLLAHLKPVEPALPSEAVIVLQVSPLA